MTLRVLEVSDPTELGAHRAEWDDLAARATVGDLFQTYGWLVPWLSTFWADRPIAFRFVYDDATLVGVVPLLRDTEGEIWCAGSLTTPVNPHVRRQGILASAAPDQILSAVLDHAFRTRAGPVVFRELPLGGLDSQALTDTAAADGYAVLPHPESSSSIADLAGGWDAYVAARTKHTAREMRRKVRKLAPGDGWTVRCVSGARDWETAFDEVLTVESRSWKHPEGTSIANERGAATFYREVSKLGAERGALRIVLLEHAGRPVAHVLGLRDRDALLALKTAYDEEYRNRSAGAVVMWHALELAAREGATRFDFLGDASRWKKELGSEDIASRTVCVFSRTSVRCQVCRSIETGVKPLARRIGVSKLARMLRPTG